MLPQAQRSQLHLCCGATGCLGELQRAAWRGSTLLEPTAHAHKAHVPKNHVPGIMEGKSVVFFSPLALSVY